MEIKENISLKKHNTFGVDVKARYFVELNSTSDIINFVVSRRMQSHAVFILNGGSNVLFTRDFEGMVLKINNRGFDVIAQTKSSALIRVNAGHDWDEFVMYALSQGFFGFENLSMIPGNVGAAPMQNIGADGIEQESRFHHLEAIDIRSGEIKEFDHEACKFAYRSSVFKTELKGKYIILRVFYQLSKKPDTKVEYGAIRSQLAELGIERNYTPAMVAQAVRTIRSQKLPDPSELGNAGSFFKNPVVNSEKYYALKKDYPDISAYPTGDENYKIAAGWLIDYLGWKGHREGDAGVCKTQALVLVNYGKATGSEMLNLAREIQKSVQQKFGIALEMEVNII